MLGEFSHVLPCFCVFRDLELAIPGSYVPNQAVIRISQVNSSLQVITSKQRPRKLCITGSNGKEYMFLLKGHEDLRQDERVMQLFSLVNTLLIHDPETFRRNLTIQVRCSITCVLVFVIDCFIFLFRGML